MVRNKELSRKQVVYTRARRKRTTKIVQTKMLVSPFVLLAFMFQDKLVLLLPGLLDLVVLVVVVPNVLKISVSENIVIVITDGEGVGKEESDDSIVSILLSNSPGSPDKN